MMALGNVLFNYFKPLICKEDQLNFEFNCYCYLLQNFIIFRIFLCCLHFLKFKLNLNLSFYLLLIFKMMKLNSNYLLKDLLKNFVIIFKNFLVSYLFKLKDALNSGDLFNFIKSNLSFSLIFILQYFLVINLLAEEAIERLQRKFRFLNLFFRMILHLRPQ